MGDLSSHFSRAEFRCHGFSQANHPPHGYVISPVLITFLERLRTELGDHPLKIVSGHRCPWWNRKIGGALHSEHILGEAADLETGVATEAQARAAGFRGLGVCEGWAVHVDTRLHAVTFRDC